MDEKKHQQELIKITRILPNIIQQIKGISLIEEDSMLLFFELDSIIEQLNTVYFDAKKAAGE